MPEQSIDSTLPHTIDQFWDSVPRVWHIIRGNVRTIASEQFGISVEQFHVLRHIRKGLTSVRDIAEARQISRPAVSQAAELLVAKGLITRREAAGDRRFVHLALTPAGEALLDAIFAHNRAWMQAKMASLNSEDLTLITQGLALLKSTFDSTAE